MLEWYRPGWDEHRLAGEVIDLLVELSGLGGGREDLSWREAFIRHAGLDPLGISNEALAALTPAAGNERAAALDLLWCERVEPRLGAGRWTVVGDWLPEAAAQARLREDGEGRRWAARFEVFREGLELANGYWELSDADELVRRLEAELAGRDTRDLLRDERFEAAMRSGLPDCAGVAVGFDRVVMLALGLDDIADAVAFPAG
jgi:lysyl-tRNA synthetase class 2